MGKTKLGRAWERFRFSDPGWDAYVIPVAGDGGYGVVASKVDPHTNWRRYGRVLAIYARKAAADNAAMKLNKLKSLQAA